MQYEFLGFGLERSVLPPLGPPHTHYKLFFTLQIPVLRRIGHSSRPSKLAN